MARVSQYYQVEQISRALDFKLKWHKKNQGFIFGEKSQYGSNTAEDEEEVQLQNFEGEGVGDDNIGEEVMTPSSAATSNVQRTIRSTPSSRCTSQKHLKGTGFVLAAVSFLRQTSALRRNRLMSTRRSL